MHSKAILEPRERLLCLQRYASKSLSLSVMKIVALGLLEDSDVENLFSTHNFGFLNFHFS